MDMEVCMASCTVFLASIGSTSSVRASLTNTDIRHEAGISESDVPNIVEINDMGKAGDYVLGRLSQGHHVIVTRQLLEEARLEDVISIAPHEWYQRFSVLESAA